MARRWDLQTALIAAGLPASVVPVSVAAQVTGYTAATIQRWVRDGQVTAYGVPWGVGKYLVDLAQILKPIAPIGKPSRKLRYAPTAETREKMKVSQRARWAHMKAQLAANASAVVPPSEPPTE